MNFTIARFRSLNPLKSKECGPQDLESIGNHILSEVLTFVRPSILIYSTRPVRTTDCSRASKTFLWCAKTRTFPPVISSARMSVTCLREQSKSEQAQFWTCKKKPSPRFAHSKRSRCDAVPEMG